MPNNPPFNVIVDFLVFQTPYIFTKDANQTVEKYDQRTELVQRPTAQRKPLIRML